MVSSDARRDIPVPSSDPARMRGIGGLRYHPKTSGVIEGLHCCPIDFIILLQEISPEHRSELSINGNVSCSYLANWLSLSDHYESSCIN
jgi:hypothetical protein